MLVQKMEKLVFISYSTKDKEIAFQIVDHFESKGIGCYIAPRDIQPGGSYASKLTRAICDSKAIVLVASDAINSSEHVLNEIDLAFQRLPNNIKFKPLKIDDAMFTPSFSYYLSRQHWMDAIDPPLEDRLDEFVHKLIDDL